MSAERGGDPLLGSPKPWFGKASTSTIINPDDDNKGSSDEAQAVPPPTVHANKHHRVEASGSESSAEELVGTEEELPAKAAKWVTLMADQDCQVKYPVCMIRLLTNDYLEYGAQKA